MSIAFLEKKIGGSLIILVFRRSATGNKLVLIQICQKWPKRCKIEIPQECCYGMKYCYGAQCSNWSILLFMQLICFFRNFGFNYSDIFYLSFLKDFTIDFFYSISDTRVALHFFTFFVL